ncbi:MAG TPA: hypothetical protein VFB63_03220 [Bryobacteraceae bacterium]|nr:hypothetical protein [Bryobacteraceae bacterium]
MASLPLLTEPEWNLLRAGTGQLPADVRVEVDAEFGTWKPLHERLAATLPVE